MTRWIPYLGVAIAALGVAGTGHGAPFSDGTVHVRLEGGPVWQSKNDVQIPNDDTGTRFSLSDLVGSGPIAFGRIYLGWSPGGRHEVTALAAPLTFEESAVPDVPLDFAGERFAAGQSVSATYQFNSWRVGYRYRFEPSPRWRNWIGFTAKVRDAKVELRQGGVRGRDTDVGFVPLLHLGTAVALSEDWTVFANLDGLAGGPGRAFDGTLQLQRSLGRDWKLGAGYRTLEGGADVDSVYNFALLNYGVVSLSRSF